MTVYPQCNEEGCTREGDCPCWSPHTDRNAEPDYEYCWEHARNAGFCPSCGNFWAGVESFDFHLNGTDVCENCYDEYDYDDAYDDDDNYGDEYTEWFDVTEEETGGRYIGPGSEYEAPHDHSDLTE